MSDRPYSPAMLADRWGVSREHIWTCGSVGAGKRVSLMHCEWSALFHSAPPFDEPLLSRIPWSRLTILPRQSAILSWSDSGTLCLHRRCRGFDPLTSHQIYKDFPILFVVPLVSVELQSGPAVGADSASLTS